LKQNHSVKLGEISLNLQTLNPMSKTKNKSKAVKENYLSSKIFKNRGEIHGSSRTDTLSILASLKVSSNTTNRELETSFVASRDALFGCARSLGFVVARHC